MDIVWKGNEHTNSSSRQGYVPFVIVNHISVGSLSSMDNWFTSPDNTVSSAHFGVGKDGSIHQYVSMDRMAWANGLSQAQLALATAPIVKEMGVNPNLYTVSIEHEGYEGDLTEAQFQASVGLHRSIRQYIRDTWGKDFPLDNSRVIGHYQINPVQKPNCPGPKFPWERLYAALAEEGDESMEELLSRIAALEEANKQLTAKISALEGLAKLASVPAWAKDAIDKAVAGGLVDTPQGGSFDFYRFITILNRMGLLK